MSTAHPASHFFESQRLKLHYVDWGNPAASPLLLIHGGLDHCRSWDWVADHLRARWHVIAPDLRGHGDSEWSSDGNYSMLAMVTDLALMIQHLDCGSVSIVAHSLGGNISLRYAGLYPERVRQLVVIEGLGPSPRVLAEREQKSMPQRLREWISARSPANVRQPRRYANFAEALSRMQAGNRHLSAIQAEHLARQAAKQNDDGSWSWKFDNLVRAQTPVDISQAALHELWSAISCPTLLCYGANSWASNPAQDGRARHFRNARVATFADAGHWLHHDQLGPFMQTIGEFLQDS
jgi:pimeloyl-ACP methyl ester carboxylesterase